MKGWKKQVLAAMISSFYINKLDMHRLQFHHAIPLLNLLKDQPNKSGHNKSLNSEEVQYEQVSVL